MDQSLYFVLGWGAPFASALFALYLIRTINRQSPGTERMQRIAALIRTGAMAFLRTEYTVLAGFVAVMFLVLWLFLPGNSLLTAVSFLVGALLSASAGWIGMRTATGAAVRTTHAATESLSRALRVAFSSGAVMGLTVVALGTFGIAALYFAYGGLSGEGRSAVESLFGFSLGASSIALFARVGGGIYTKAADVAGDLSGKVEAGIPEDDPRNPATIADNVGDNVGDVAGMGADLFESYVGSIISSIALAWALGAGAAAALWGVDESAFGELQRNLVVFPILLAGTGILASILGTFVVNTDDESKIGSALHRGLLVASFLVFLGAGALIFYLGIPLAVLWCVVFGVVAGVAIGQLTEYYTGKDKPPAHRIAQQSETGPATNIIAGLGVGMMSCAPADPRHLRRHLRQLLVRRALRHRDRRGRHALHPRHQPRRRRLRTGGRQRGGHRGDEPLGAIRPRADRRARRGRQHDGGHGQGLRHRLGGADRARAVQHVPGHGGHRRRRGGRRGGLRPAPPQPGPRQSQRAARHAARRDAAVPLLGADDERGRPAPRTT